MRIRLAHFVAGPRRFTPTRVGTTLMSPGSVAANPVHPHARGDDATASITRCSRCGSPPRAWGRLPETDGANRRSSVHPHARGDDAAQCGIAVIEERFTPTRVGTTRSRVGLPGLLCRFTPTRVGTTGDPDWVAAIELGSPPRAWGRLSHPATI